MRDYWLNVTTCGGFVKPLRSFPVHINRSLIALALRARVNTRIRVLNLTNEIAHM